MDHLRPIVINDHISAVDFVQYVLDHHQSASYLVVCSTKDAFFEKLRETPTQATHERDFHESDDDPTEQLRTAVPSSSRRAWTILPTLRLLSTTRTVKVAFCPDLTHLRAYLATHSSRTFSHPSQVQHTKGVRDPLRILAICNPINLHRPTSAFSAQGLNRTFSIAVEAAHRTGSKLVMAECASSHSSTSHLDPDPIGGDVNEPVLPPESVEAHADPWSEEVSILNVTTKTFGAGERGWVGRTVQIRAIAARWCTFQTYDDDDDDDDDGKVH